MQLSPSHASILVEDPIRTWEYAERYLGVGTRTYSPFSADLDISPIYHPQAGTGTFTLPTFLVPYERGAYLGSRLFNGDVVAALKPFLQADPEVRIYQVV